jgi:hypothetical protein
MLTQLRRDRARHELAAANRRRPARVNRGGLGIAVDGQIKIAGAITISI